MGLEDIGDSFGSIASGAGAGAMIGGPMGALVGGGLGLASSLLGGSSARAAQQAAMAQAEEARRQQAMILQQGGKNRAEAMSLADASPQELAALSRAYSQTSTQLDRQERLLQAVDPAIMEASNQVLKLIRGESAGLSQALGAQRQSQRQALVNSLRSRFGPDAENSSIGQRILSQFDMQSDVMHQQAQQSSLSQAMGVAGHDFGAPQTRNIGQLQQIGQGYGALQERKLNASMGTGNAMLAALGGSSAPVIQSAGAPYVGDALRAQSNSSFMNNAMNAGVQFGLANIMYGGKGQNPVQTSGFDRSTAGAPIDLPQGPLGDNGFNPAYDSQSNRRGVGF